MKKKILIMGITSILLFTSLTTLSATGLKVGVSNVSSGYIQSLIDAANPGDTVFIPSGTYYENVVIDKPLNLIGEDKTNTIINGGRKEDTVTISSSYVKISGFTIEEGADPEFPNDIGNGVWICESSIYCIVSDNIIRDNAHYGILIQASSNKNTISNNILKENPSGLLIVSSDNCIDGNTFIDNDYGVETVVFVKNNTISNNIIKNNGVGVYIRESVNAKICGNVIEGNKQGIHVGLVYNDGLIEISGNIIKNNKEGIYILEPSVIVEKNDILENNKGVFVFWAMSGVKINSNNFKGNRMGATFEVFWDDDPAKMTIDWDGNYWDRPRYFPKLILGFKEIFIFPLIPVFKFDYNPAKEEFEI